MSETLVTGPAQQDAAAQVQDLWVEGETMRVNMGPQHPSTHGVLRLQVEMTGETLLSVNPVIGYLHTGIEKNAEVLNWIQAVTAVTRADYLSNFFNEAAFCMAVERLAEVEVPERAQWIRCLMMELNRITSHLIWLGTSGLELGSVSMATYAFREREMILDVFQSVTGLRMNPGYFRPGGVSMDLPAEAEGKIRELLRVLPGRFDEYEALLSANPIWVQRNRGIGILSAADAIAYGVTGPPLRASGVD
ncbi:MAG TPA: NADH dehydrogenase subunit D, partial [Actinomycetota bacterium]|nr:NADH dehydrogenase subunit D [Actinomycetota bacterium]